MFPVVSSTPRVHGELRALRLSLNTPVVTIEDLPVGPAIAGIALHAQPEGLRLTLAVRSVRTGHVVFFLPDEDWSEIQGSELAVEAALSFAECMGFLFDDDPIEAGGDVLEAARRWAARPSSGCTTCRTRSPTWPRRRDAVPARRQAG